MNGQSAANHIDFSLFNDIFFEMGCNIYIIFMGRVESFEYSPKIGYKYDFSIILLPGQ